ncbi:MAG: DUF624 domain-containing protein, partial [Ruminococcus sp.]|nr:DUF624 domain-containing protein [Ruminococcus sp.]
PKKTGLALFFDLFFRKIDKITGLNLLMSIFLLPFPIAFALIRYVDNINILLALLIVLFLAFAVNIGPATAGMTKVMRAFLIEKHTFVIRDFFRGYRENFGKACIIGVVDVIAGLSAYACCKFYPYCAEIYNSKLFYIPLVISLSVLLIVFMMNYYIFLMLTATDLSMKNLIKNSFALAFVSLKSNLITTLMIIFFIILMGLIFLFATGFAIIILPFFPLALTWFIVCFNSYPVIQKFVINPYYDSIGEINPELADAGSDIDEEPIFEDMGGKEKPIEIRKKGKGKRIS